MLVILLLLTISFPLLFLFKCRNYYASKLYRRPPGPCGLPLIGNMHQFDSSNTHLYLFQLSQKYGPLVYLQLGSVPTLVVSSASAAKEVFKYHDQCFSSRPALVGTQKLSYNGLDLAFLVPRETIDKCVVSSYEIEAKTRVYVNVYAIGRDPESWENPNEFLPERFIGSSIDFKGRDFELIPFGAGRRICPGIAMGVAMTELVLANLLYSFNWELPPGTKFADIDMATLPGLTTHKKNDLCLVPKIIN